MNAAFPSLASQLPARMHKTVSFPHRPSRDLHATCLAILFVLTVVTAHAQSPSAGLAPTAPDRHEELIRLLRAHAPIEVKRVESGRSTLVQRYSNADVDIGSYTKFSFYASQGGGRLTDVENDYANWLKSSDRSLKNHWPYFGIVMLKEMIDNRFRFELYDANLGMLKIQAQVNQAMNADPERKLALERKSNPKGVNQAEKAADAARAEAVVVEIEQYYLDRARMHVKTLGESLAARRTSQLNTAAGWVKLLDELDFDDGAVQLQRQMYLTFEPSFRSWEPERFFQVFGDSTGGSATRTIERTLTNASIKIATKGIPSEQAAISIMPYLQKPDVRDAVPSVDFRNPLLKITGFEAKSSVDLISNRTALESALQKARQELSMLEPFAQDYRKKAETARASRDAAKATLKKQEEAYRKARAAAETARQAPPDTVREEAFTLENLKARLKEAQRTGGSSEFQATLSKRIKELEAVIAEAELRAVKKDERVLELNLRAIAASMPDRAAERAFLENSSALSFAEGRLKDFERQIELQRQIIATVTPKLAVVKAAESKGSLISTVIVEADTRPVYDIFGVTANNQFFFGERLALLDQAIKDMRTQKGEAEAALQAQTLLWLQAQTEARNKLSILRDGILKGSYAKALVAALDFLFEVGEAATESGPAGALVEASYKLAEAYAFGGKGEVFESYDEVKGGARAAAEARYRQVFHDSRQSTLDILPGVKIERAFENSVGNPLKRSVIRPMQPAQEWLLEKKWISSAGASKGGLPYWDYVLAIDPDAETPVIVEKLLKANSSTANSIQQRHREIGTASFNALGDFAARAIKDQALELVKSELEEFFEAQPWRDYYFADIHACAMFGPLQEAQRHFFGVSDQLDAMMASRAEVLKNINPDGKTEIRMKEDFERDSRLTFRVTPIEGLKAEQLSIGGKKFPVPENGVVECEASSLKAGPDGSLQIELLIRPDR